MSRPAEHLPNSPANCMLGLPIKDGVRQRGQSMTRIEAFTDAAFAFATTLLVISIDQVPTSVGSMVNILAGVPAFLFSFMLLMWLWHGHHVWSRRYGLENSVSIWLSCALVFCILCFVYPLKFLHALAVFWMTSGRISYGVDSTSAGELNLAFTLYAIGMLVCSLVLVAHYVYALHCRTRLDLSPLEQMSTRHSAYEWCIPALVSLLAIAVAQLGIGAASPGLCFMLLAVFMPVFGIWSERRRKAYAAANAADPAAPGSGPDR